MSWRPAVFACVLVLLLLGSAGHAGGATMYWGATLKGSVYGYGPDSEFPEDPSVLDRFEHDAGKNITFVNTGQEWASFDTPKMQAAIDAGAIPLVTMGLPSDVTLQEVAEGRQDQEIRTWARQAKAWGYPFLFRPWWEVNGTWYAWGRDPSYIAAWRHFHDLVVEEGASNVTWAWIVNTIWKDPESDPTPFYPGDAYVDWVGMDAYNWGKSPVQPDHWVTPEQAIGPTLEVLRHIAPDKPVCICEDASTEFGGNKESWVRELLGSYLPDNPDIKAFLWFNWNVEQNGGYLDWPIESSPAAEQAFRDGIQSSAYLGSLPSLTKLTKVPLPTAPSQADSVPSRTAPTPLPGGSWSAATDLGSAGGATRDADLAVGPDGEATLVWEHDDGAHDIIEARRLGPGGVADGPILDLSPTDQNAFEPRVALDSSGTATVVWKRFDGADFIVEDRRIESSGVPEADAHQLSAAGQDAGQPEVTSMPDGGATVVWERYNGWQTVVQARQISPDGAPAAEFNEISNNQEDAVEPQVASSSDGGVVVVWDRHDGSNQIVQERRIDPAGSLESEAHDLSVAGENAIEPQVAVAADGTATVIWTRSNGTDDVVESRQITAAGGVGGSVEELSEAGHSATEARLAVVPSGGAFVVWERSDGTSQVVQERHLLPDGSPEAGVRTLSAVGQSAYEPEVAVESQGAGVVVWDRSDGSNTVVQAQRIASDGSPEGSTADLSARGGDAGDPVVAVGPDDEIVGSWRRFDGAEDRAEAAFFGVARMSIEPAFHDFGEVSVGSDSDSSGSFSIVNTGNAALAISAISLGGQDAKQFRILDASTCLAGMIEPGDSCAVSAAFTPGSPGASEAELEVASNTASSPGVVILSGVGVPTVAATSPEVATPPSTEGAGSQGGSPATAPGPSIQTATKVAVGKPKLDRKVGAAKLPISVSAPGELEVSGPHIRVRTVPSRARAVRSVTRSVAGGGTVTIEVIPVVSKLRALEMHHRCRVTALVTYRPAGEGAIEKRVSLILERSGG